MLINRKRWILCLLLSFCLVFSGIMTGCTKQEEDQNIPIVTETNKKDESEQSQAPAQPETLLKPSEVLARAPEVYTYAIRLTINPDFVFYLNERNEVISYEPLNDDAKKMDNEGRMAITNRPFQDAVKDVIMVAIDDGYLKEGVDIKITLLGTGKTEAVTQELLSEVHKSIQDTAKERSIIVIPSIEVDSSVQYVPDPSEQSESSQEENSTEEPSELDDEDSSEEESDENSDEDAEDEDSSDDEDAEDEDSSNDEDAEDEDGEDEDAEDEDGEDQEERRGCSVCQGSGECDVCDGAGEVSCYKCDGTGQMYCPSCGGGGQEDCDCEGGLCESCGGTGHNEDGDPCPTCQGSGQCTKCGGTSLRDCPHCEGTGLVECDQCGGDGMEECPNCEGTGNCAACGGSGYAPED